MTTSGVFWARFWNEGFVFSGDCARGSLNCLCHGDFVVLGASSRATLNCCWTVEI